MTGRFKLGKISIGMRVRARIEHKATPITRTMTEIGLRRALRNSHIIISLPESCFGTIRERARDRLAPPRPTPGSAKPRAARVRRRFPLVLESSAHLKHR